MAKYQITLHRNTGATAEQAPYLGTYVGKGSIPWTEILKDTSNRCGMPVDEVEAILDGSFDEIVKLEILQATRFDLGFGVVRPVITGSFEASDSAFDPAKNTYELAMYFKKDIKNALVNVRPEIVSEEGAIKVKLGNVFSKNQPRPYGVLRLGEVARGTGEHLVFTDEGAALKLEDVKSGAMIDIPLTGVTSEKPNVFEFTVPENMLPGDYKVWVMSRGGDAEGAVQSVSYRVKVIAAPAPTGPVITGVTSSGLEDDHLHNGYDNLVHGVNIKVNEGDKIFLTLTTADGETEENEQTNDVVSSTDTEIQSAAEGFWPREATHPDSDWTDPESVVKLKLVKASGETAEYRVYLDND